MVKVSGIMKVNAESSFSQSDSSIAFAAHALLYLNRRSSGRVTEGSTSIPSPSGVGSEACQNDSGNSASGRRDRDASIMVSKESLGSNSTTSMAVDGCPVSCPPPMNNDRACRPYIQLESTDHSRSMDESHGMLDAQQMSGRLAPAPSYQDSPLRNASPVSMYDPLSGPYVRSGSGISEAQQRHCEAFAPEDIVRKLVAYKEPGLIASQISKYEVEVYQNHVRICQQKEPNANKRRLKVFTGRASVRRKEYGTSLRKTLLSLLIEQMRASGLRDVECFADVEKSIQVRAEKLACQKKEKAMQKEGMAHLHSRPGTKKVTKGNLERTKKNRGSAAWSSALRKELYDGYKRELDRALAIRAKGTLGVSRDDLRTGNGVDSFSEHDMAPSSAAAISKSSSDVEDRKEFYSRLDSGTSSASQRHPAPRSSAKQRWSSLPPSVPETSRGTMLLSKNGFTQQKSHSLATEASRAILPAASERQLRCFRNDEEAQAKSCPWSNSAAMELQAPPNIHSSSLNAQLRDPSSRIAKVTSSKPRSDLPSPHHSSILYPGSSQNAQAVARTKPARGRRAVPIAPATPARIQNIAGRIHDTVDYQYTGIASEHARVGLSTATPPAPYTFVSSLSPSMWPTSVPAQHILSNKCAGNWGPANHSCLEAEWHASNNAMHANEVQSGVHPGAMTRMTDIRGFSQNSLVNSCTDNLAGKEFMHVVPCASTPSVAPFYSAA